VVLCHKIQQVCRFLFYGGIDIFAVEGLVNRTDGPWKLLSFSCPQELNLWIYAASDQWYFWLRQCHSIFCLFCAFGAARRWWSKSSRIFNALEYSEIIWTMPFASSDTSSKRAILPNRRTASCNSFILLCWAFRRFFVDCVAVNQMPAQNIGRPNAELSSAFWVNSVTTIEWHQDYKYSFGVFSRQQQPVQFLHRLIFQITHQFYKYFLCA